MNPAHRSFRLAALALAAWACAARADEAAEARMRDQLRQAVTQVRTLQGENAALKAELDKAKQAASQVAAVPAEDPEALRQEREALLQEAASLQARLERDRAVLEKWKQAREQAVDLARARDAEAKKFEAQFREVDSHVQHCEQSNARLVVISRELLGHYRDKGVIDAMRDAEPVLGLHRIELERLAQEYHHRIIDSTVEPRAGDAAPPTAQGQTP